MKWLRSGLARVEEQLSWTSLLVSDECRHSNLDKWTQPKQMCTRRAVWPFIILASEWEWGSFRWLWPSWLCEHWPLMNRLWIKEKDRKWPGDEKQLGIFSNQSCTASLPVQLHQRNPSAQSYWLTVQYIAFCAQLELNYQHFNKILLHQYRQIQQYWTTNNICQPIFCR